MALISIEGDDLVVEIEGLDKLWSLSACSRHARAGCSRGRHLPRGRERIFWDVHDAAKAVVIELAGQRYARLIVQVSDPRATVALIEGATHV